MMHLIRSSYRFSFPSNYPKLLQKRTAAKKSNNLTTKFYVEYKKNIVSLQHVLSIKNTWII
ncbi:MAG: hypothetical protein AUK44_05005 [Porphyromonadaceae bacterium CG2_30_38_12]|nr:MAG: hypothetical protein AUK44_05005 [Porphyromonadaceae bacterium CG2_30_38_12]